jgi:hypothetical protein
MKPNLRYWISALREAERELKAATTRAALNTAGRELMQAKAGLKQLPSDSGAPKPA